MAKWLLGGFEEQRKAREPSRRGEEGEGIRERERESWGRITLGFVGFCFAFDEKSLKYFEQMNDMI